MAKHALCVGINNYPFEGEDLFGCVNDAQAWAALLEDHYGFPKNNITLITDDTELDTNKETIFGKLKEMVTHAQKGDILVYTFSGHGTYVADDSGDEPDFDEGQCAFDDVILDDDLRELFASLDESIHLTVISDSCHSGSITRGERQRSREFRDRRRERFLNPDLLGNTLLDSKKYKKIKKQIKRAAAQATDIKLRLQMNELLISGCAEEQSSYDAQFDGVPNGAMTYHALQAIKEMNYDLTYKQLHHELSYRIEDAGFPQTPQLQGSNKNRKLFT